MFVAMTSVLMMTVMGACTIYAAEEGGSAEVNVQTKVSGTAPEKEVFTYTLKEQGASDNPERKLTVEGAGTGTFLFHYMICCPVLTALERQSAGYTVIF